MANSGLLWELLIRTARGAPIIVSSNWAAYLISGFLFLVNSVWHFFDIKLPWHERVREAWKSKKKDILRGFVMFVAFWLILFTTSFINVLHEDRASLDSAQNENKSLRAKAEEGCKEDKQKAESAKEEAQQARFESRHWQDAYERISHHEMHPDRHLDDTDIDKMNNQLKVLSKNADRDFTTFDFGMVKDREAMSLGSQLYNMFRDAHWNMHFRGTVVPKQLEGAFERDPMPMGIVIWSDQPNGKGTFYQDIFRAAGLDTNVVPLSMLPAGFKGTVVWVGYKQFP